MTALTTLRQKVLLDGVPELLGVSMRTLQGWEQERREPTGAARTLLKVAVKHPEVLLELMR